MFLNLKPLWIRNKKNEQKKSFLFWSVYWNICTVCLYKFQTHKWNVNGNKATCIVCNNICCVHWLIDRKQHAQCWQVQHILLAHIDKHHKYSHCFWLCEKKSHGIDGIFTGMRWNEMERYILIGAMIWLWFDWRDTGRCYPVSVH